MEKRLIKGREYIVRDLDTEPKTLMEDLQEFLTEEHQNRVNDNASRVERRARLETEALYAMGIDETPSHWSRSTDNEVDTVAARGPAGEDEMIVGDEELVSCVWAVEALTRERLRIHTDGDYRVSMVEGL